MDKWQAIDKFWNSFGIPAYDENTVLTGGNSPTPPYITYNAVASRVGQEISLTASIWYKGYSWKEVSEKANEIAEAIGYGYKLEDVDGGYLYIRMGQPFAQRMGDPEDDTIRRMYIITDAEFLTAY